MERLLNQQVSIGGQTQAQPIALVYQSRHESNGYMNHSALTTE